MVRTIHEIIKDAVPYYKKKGGPDASHTLSYDSPSETLEPVYFFVIDLMTSFGYNPEKLFDNFDSSPGSGHFAELGQRATIMQQQGSKLLSDINAVLRSVLNIIYDLKEFKIRLEVYDDLKIKDKKDYAILSLKQLWMDKVDIQKGNSGIKAMALGQANFQTLIDAFLIVKDEKNVDELQLNDRVKRILKPRIAEFNSWVKHSEEELKKRYALEKNYLRSQVNSLKLYSRWAKPYLLAAQDLEKGQMGSRNPALVKVFNTILLDLTVMGKRKFNVRGAVESGELPVDFKNMKMKRDYYSCVVVQFMFRGIPQKVAQQSHFTFGGKADITFSSYAFSKDELDLIELELQKSDVEDALQLIEGTTTQSLETLQKEIDYFLEEKSDEKKEEKKDTSNPFLALIGHYEKKDNKEKKSAEKKPVNLKDTWIESKYLRPLAITDAELTAEKFFDIYKKAHGMASYT